jgi:hypothetical protein
MVREISSKHTKQTNYRFETLANFIKQALNKGGENKEQREKTFLSSKSFFTIIVATLQDEIAHKTPNLLR